MKTILTLCLMLVAGLLAGCANVEMNTTDFLYHYERGELSEYVVGYIIQHIQANPSLTLLFTGISLSMPLLGFIANQTKNPIDNAVLIFLNKVVQTLTFNSSKNQADVLSWLDMLTNKPSKWPSMLESQIAGKSLELQDRIFTKEILSS